MLPDRQIIKNTPPEGPCKMISVLFPTSMLLQRPGRLVALLVRQDCSSTPFEGWLGVTRQANNTNHAPVEAWLNVLCAFSNKHASPETRWVGALLDEQDCSSRPFDGWLGVTRKANN